MKQVLIATVVFIFSATTWMTIGLKDDDSKEERLFEPKSYGWEDQSSTGSAISGNSSNGNRIEPDTRSPQYDITLNFKPTESQLIGNSSISVWNRSDLSTKQIFVNLYLNAFEGNDQPVLPEFMEKAYPAGVKYGSVEIRNVTVGGESVRYDVNGTSLTITLNQEWSPGEKRRIEIDWSATLPQIHHRVGMSNDSFWFGNVLPILSVYDGNWHVYNYDAVGDPFFSEISDYSVEVTMPKGYNLYSTGRERVLDSSNSTVVVIEADQVREFAFAISSDHKVATMTTKSGIHVNLYYRNASGNQVTDTLGKSVGMLEYLEQRVGKYPYEELDIFENEMFITGMEYPGIVFVQSDRLESKSGYQTVLHEIAHQWFYNMIGNNQITEPWLDEGFATYFVDEYVYGERLDDYYSEQLEKINHHGSDIQMGDVRFYKKWSAYWTANYRKSSLMIYALHQRLGDEEFSRFLHDYFQFNQYGIVTGTSFMEQAQRYTESSLLPFFNEWIGEANKVELDNHMD